MKIDLIFPRWQVDLSNSTWSGISEGVGRTGRTTEVGVVGVTPRTTTEVGVVGTTATTKRGRTHTNEDFHAKATVIQRRPRLQKRWNATNEDYHGEVQPSSGRPRLQKRSNAHERSLSCQRQPSSGRPRLYKGRTHTNEADYVKDDRRWNKEGRRDDVRKDDFRKSQRYGTPNRKPTPQVSEYITADFAERRSLQVKNPRLKGRGNLYCAICNVMCSDEVNYNKHINGRRHKNMMKRLGLKPDTKTGKKDQATAFKYSKMGFNSIDEIKQMSNEKKQELEKKLEDENNVLTKTDRKLAQQLLDPTTPYIMDLVEGMKSKDPECALNVYKEMKHRQIEATAHMCNMILQLICTAICDKQRAAIFIKNW